MGGCDDVGVWSKVDPGRVSGKGLRMLARIGGYFGFVAWDLTGRAYRWRCQTIDGGYLPGSHCNSLQHLWKI